MDKPVYKSKGVMGGAGSIASIVLMLATQTGIISPEEVAGIDKHMAAIITAGMAIISSCIGIYGRIKAKTAVVFLRKN